MNIENPQVWMQVSYNCPICSLPYNQFNRIAQTLEKCGHPICSSCLQYVLLEAKDTFKCPFDQPKLEVPQNLHAPIVQNQEPEYPHEHRLDSEYYPSAPQKIQMENGGKVRNEDVENQNDISVIELKAFKEQANHLLDIEKESQLRLMEEKFRKMHQLLNKKEEELWADISSYFMVEKKKEEDRIQSDLPLKEETEQVMRDLSDKMLENFFQALEKEIQQFSAKIGYDALVQQTHELTEKFCAAQEQFENSTHGLLYQFQPVFPNIDEQLPFKLKIEQKMGRVRNILSFDLCSDCVIISARSISNANKGDGENVLIRDGIKWGEIRKIKLDFQKKELSKASIEALEYIWLDIGPVSELEMNLSNKEFDNRGLIELSQATFWQTSQIQRFEIALRGCDISDESVVKMLNGPFKRMKGLRHLTINLKRTKISDVFINILNNSTLNELRNLESFELYLSGTQVTDNGVTLLCQKMGQTFKMVKTFILDLRSLFLPNTTIPALVDVFTMFKYLRVLKLELCGSPLNKAYIRKFCANIEPIAKNIITLGLNLTRTAIQGKCLKILGRTSLVIMDALQDFSLYVSETAVNDRGVCKMFESMRADKKKFRSFVVTLNKTKIGNDTLKAFTKYVLPYLKNVEKFGLEAYSTRVTDVGAEPMCIAMGTPLRNVKNFMLDLVNTGITDRSMNALGLSIVQHMYVLESFTLGLLGTKVTDSSIISLCKSLSTSTERLKTLILELANTNITDESLKVLSYNLLPYATALEDFTLGLSGTHVTDAGIFLLHENLREVKAFTLSLNYTKITDASIEKLANKVQPAVKMPRKFQVDLYHTQTSDSMKNLMSNVQQRLSKV